MLGRLRSILGNAHSPVNPVSTVPVPRAPGGMVSFVSVVTSRPVVPEASYYTPDGIDFPGYIDIMLSYLSDFELGEVARAATTAYNGFFHWQRFARGRPRSHAAGPGSQAMDPQCFLREDLQEFLKGYMWARW